MSKKSNPTILLFGGTGDLARKKLYPSIYQLWQDDYVDEPNIIVLGRSDLEREEFLDEAKPTKNITNGEGFEAFITYVQVDYEKDDQTYLREAVEEIEQESSNRIYYLSLPASAFGKATNVLERSGLLEEDGWDRVVFEKPFGHNQESAHSLNESITSVFKEEQIYRVDHYLGKELIQNLMIMRFANPIFENIWNNEYVENVQISFCENFGIGERAEYYDDTGAVKDVIQNHMMQVLSLCAMEKPASRKAEDLNKEKIKVLQEIKDVPQENIVLGQYTSGSINGNNVRGYRDEKDVPKDSQTETYAALKLEIANERWEGVPFYVQAGKRLKRTYSEINISFKKSPHAEFLGCPEMENNVLTIRMKPEEAIELKFNARVPDHGFETENVTMDYCHDCLYEGNTPDAYERIFHDVIKGDKSIFIPWKVIDTSWDIVDSIAEKDNPVNPYPSGVLIPDEARDLMRRDERRWIVDHERLHHE